MLKLPLLRRCTVAATVLACFGPPTAAAQRLVPALDLGASSVRYADSPAITATVLAPSFRVESSNTTLTASAVYSQASSGAWTTQGAFSGSAFVPVRRRFHGELVGSAGGSAHEDATRTGQALAQARLHFIGAARGVWAGAGAGGTFDGAAWRAVGVADAGLWMTTGPTMLLAAVTPTAVADPGAASLRYTDMSAGARRLMPGAELAASVGARLGRGLPISGSPSAWGSVSATVWIARGVALSASAGSYPIDYTQGYPGGRFAAVLLRLAPRPVSSGGRAGSNTAIDGHPAGPGAVTEFVVGPAADGRHRTIVVRAPAAQSVEVTADFTGWQPMRLARRRDGAWAATLAVPAGMHEVAVRVDGGAWVVPPGLTAIRDELGGVVGLLLVR